MPTDPVMQHALEVIEDQRQRHRRPADAAEMITHLREAARDLRETLPLMQGKPVLTDGTARVVEMLDASVVMFQSWRSDTEPPEIPSMTAPLGPSPHPLEVPVRLVAAREHAVQVQQILDSRPRASRLNAAVLHKSMETLVALLSALRDTEEALRDAD